MCASFGNFPTYYSFLGASLTIRLLGKKSSSNSVGVTYPRLYKTMPSGNVNILQIPHDTVLKKILGVLREVCSRIILLKKPFLQPTFEKSTAQCRPVSKFFQKKLKYLDCSSPKISKCQLRKVNSDT